MSVIENWPYNQSLEFAPALVGPTPDGLSAPLQARRSASRYKSKGVRMRFTKILLVSVFLAAGANAAFACSSDRPVLSTEKDDGTKVGLFISTTQIEAAPEWNPEDGEPPLSISTAYRLVKDWGNQEYARYDSVEVQGLRLTAYGCSRVSNRWYYVIDLAPVIDGNKLWGSGNWAAVLMDGTVIGPREF